MKGATALFLCMCIAMFLSALASNSHIGSVQARPSVERLLPAARAEQDNPLLRQGREQSSLAWMAAGATALRPGNDRTLGGLEESFGQASRAAGQRRPATGWRVVEDAANRQSSDWPRPHSEGALASPDLRSASRELAVAGPEAREATREAMTETARAAEEPQTTAGCRTDGRPRKSDYAPISAAVDALMAAGADRATAETLTVFADRETSGWTDYDGSGRYDRPDEVLDGYVDPGAVNSQNSDGSSDYGAWQINDHAWRRTFTEEWANICDLAVNARVALQIWDRAGTSPWCLPAYLDSTDLSKRARATGCPDGPPAIRRPPEPLVFPVL